MTELPDWAQFIADAVEIFGPDVRVLNLRLDSVPGYELGESSAERAKRAGMRFETYEHNMPGFGTPVEEAAPALPVGWKLRGAQ